MKPDGKNGYRRLILWLAVAAPALFFLLICG